MKLADLERHLRLHGCVLKRQGGAHTIWEDPANRTWTAVPRHREVKDHLARRICRQLEIPQW
ncbi:MAG TPA: type II toxin-antitoxin system HicA family toxin [Verrucomicrobiae bacterium]